MNINFYLSTEISFISESEEIVIPEYKVLVCLRDDPFYQVIYNVKGEQLAEKCFAHKDLLDDPYVKIALKERCQKQNLPPELITSRLTPPEKPVKL